MKKISSVIFDMDGVITRTETIQSGTESEVFASVGVNITPEAILKKYSGWKDTEMFEDMIKQYDIKEDPNVLQEKKWEIVYKKLEDESLPVVPGVLEFIDELKKEEYTLALASSSNRKFISTVLTSLHLTEKFTAIASGDDVSAGKPNPEIFLLAAKKLKTSPQDCLVIEDAPSGVQAAKAAGMKCIAITTSVTKEELHQADKIIDSFSEITVNDIINL